MFVNEYANVLFVFLNWVSNKSHKRLNNRRWRSQEYAVEVEFYFTGTVCFFQRENVCRVVIDIERNVSPVVAADFALYGELSSHGASHPI